MRRLFLNCDAMAHPYRGRTAALATMHGKQAAIAPAMRQWLAMELIIPQALDTDRLGTFSGEVKRPGPMLETAIAKARLGMELSGLPLGLASEGSFGPHPDAPFIAAGIELLVLVDGERDLTISERQLFAETNYCHATGRRPADFGGFTEKAGFPDHALIVRPNRPAEGSGLIHKGIQRDEQLHEAIAECAALSNDGLAFVQTDMRAHMNPGRMATIATLASRFADRLSNLCPSCSSPGYGPSGSIAGLPCEWCGKPSTLVRWIVEKCPACSHQERKARPDGQLKSDPMFCVSCNP